MPFMGHAAHGLFLRRSEAIRFRSQLVRTASRSRTGLGPSLPAGPCESSPGPRGAPVLPASGWSGVPRTRPRELFRPYLNHYQYLTEVSLRDVERPGNKAISAEALNGGSTIMESPRWSWRSGGQRSCWSRALGLALSPLPLVRRSVAASSQPTSPSATEPVSSEKPGNILSGNRGERCCPQSTLP
jgi:hypothetical protein